jgi:hypothetical protein
MSRTSKVQATQVIVNDKLNAWTFMYISEFLATDPEAPGSIPGATSFSEKQWVWNGVHSGS